MFSYLRYIYIKRVNRLIATFPFSRVISSVKRVLVTQLELARAKIREQRFEIGRITH